jgi:hypothetical protein
MRNLNIRLPDPLHERLKQAAECDDRSLNGEILWLLKAGLDARGAPGLVYRPPVGGTGGPSPNPDWYDVDKRQS